jgi:hypothetical protein
MTLFVVMGRIAATSWLAGVSVTRLRRWFFQHFLTGIRCPPSYHALK